MSRPSRPPRFRPVESAARWLRRPDFFVAFLLLLLAGPLACGGSNDGAPARSPSNAQHPPELQQALDDLEGEVGFRPLAPTYFPAGVDPAPETAHVRDETQQTAILAFFPAAGQELAPAPPSVLEITEDPAARFECPLCPGEGFTELELAGEPALAEEGEAGDGVVYYALYFVAGDVLVVLNAEWDDPGGSGSAAPTDEMKQELARVAESMLAQV